LDNFINGEGYGNKEKHYSLIKINTMPYSATSMPMVKLYIRIHNMMNGLN